MNSALFPPDRAPCAVIAYDYIVLAGPQGLSNHDKVDQIAEVCTRKALLIIWFRAAAIRRKPTATALRG